MAKLSEENQVKLIELTGRLEDLKESRVGVSEHVAKLVSGGKTSNVLELESALVLNEDKLEMPDKDELMELALDVAKSLANPDMLSQEDKDKLDARVEKGQKAIDKFHETAQGKFDKFGFKMKVRDEAICKIATILNEEIIKDEQEVLSEIAELYTI